MQQKNPAFLNLAAEDFGIAVLRIKKQVRITLSFKVIGSLILEYNLLLRKGLLYDIISVFVHSLEIIELVLVLKYDIHPAYHKGSIVSFHSINTLKINQSCF